MELKSKGVHTSVLDMKAYLDALKKQTLADIAGGSFNALVGGELGTGKSHLFITCRKPVIIHAFDPGSARLSAYRPLIERGELIVVDYSNEGGYERWEKDFEQMRADGVFQHIGTYGIDSFTTFFRSMKMAFVKSKQRVDDIPYQSDYLVLGQNVINICMLCTAEPCDFILTSHLTLEKEEVSGKMVARFKSIPSLQVDVPTLFDEIYVLTAESGREKVERSLITQPTSRYVARTRIGGGIFNVREEPDIMKLLKKAGLPVEGE